MQHGWRGMAARGFRFKANGYSHRAGLFDCIQQSGGSTSTKSCEYGQTGRLGDSNHQIWGDPFPLNAVDAVESPELGGVHFLSRFFNGTGQLGESIHQSGGRAYFAPGFWIQSKTPARRQYPRDFGGSISPQACEYNQTGRLGDSIHQIWGDPFPPPAPKAVDAIESPELRGSISFQDWMQWNKPCVGVSVTCSVGGWNLVLHYPVRVLGCCVVASDADVHAVFAQLCLAYFICFALDAQSAKRITREDTKERSMRVILQAWPKMIASHGTVSSRRAAVFVSAWVTFWDPTLGSGSQPVLVTTFLRGGVA